MSGKEPQLRADIRALTAENAKLKAQLAEKQSKRQRDAEIAGLKAQIGQLEREVMMLKRRLGE
jgi:cell division protein FtsB